ncbi:hypothetical protein ASE07_22765 [Noviherbaspirillum sp. Root189]|nr:hypothetical protein ASE07_22765 [Noviherbaspirillum sp. Root189]
MVTDKNTTRFPGRRRVLIASLLSCVTPAWSASIPASKLRIAAAWNDGHGHHIGVLARRAEGMLPVARVEVPTRAHGVLMETDGSLLAVARRPGDWMLRWYPGRGAPYWVWAEPGRAFNGHVVVASGGKRLFSTETNLETGQGLIGVWDAQSLEKLDEWDTHGIDAHMMLMDGETLLVANGGVPTQPETGRIKRNLNTMASSLVRLDARSGALLGQWKLPDHRLSMRHMARNGSRVGIAMQAEHDVKAERDAAPVLAVLDGDTLAIPDAVRVPGLAGYAGDIAAWDNGFAIGAPRANAVLRWRPDEGWLPPLALQDGCAIVSAGGPNFWASGSAKALGVESDSRVMLNLPANLKIDNHWVLA